MRMMRRYEKYDNFEYAMNLGKNLSARHYVVCLFPGGRDTITFIAYREDIVDAFEREQSCIYDEDEFMMAD